MTTPEQLPWERRRILYALVLTEATTVGLTTNHWLLTEGDAASFGPDTGLNTANIQNPWLASVIEVALSRGDCSRVEIRNSWDEDEYQQRGKVFFYLTKGSSPLHILNVLRCLLSMERLPEPEVWDDFATQVLEENLAQAAQRYLFPRPEPRRRQQ